MKNEEKFEYSYYAPTAEERKEIEDIKRQYLPSEKRDTPMERLRDLNKRVTRPPFIIALILGITGTLVLGLGMTMTLEWEMFYEGIAVGAVGLAVAGIAYPIYRLALKINKRKYGGQIIDLSNELLNVSENSVNEK